MKISFSAKFVEALRQHVGQAQAAAYLEIAGHVTKAAYPGREKEINAELVRMRRALVVGDDAITAKVVRSFRRGRKPLGRVFGGKG